MQKQVNVNAQLTLEQVHKLRIVELRLQQIIERNLGIGPRNHHVPAASINHKHANLVARNSEINSIPLSLGVAFPVNENSLVSKVAG